jgi:uncharacterized protein YjiK
MNFRILIGAITGVCALVATASAQSLNLNQYVLVGAYDMPAAAYETSAVTYNWDRDSLVVLDDEGFDVVEISKTGVELGRILLANHPPQGSVNVGDTEGLTYLGNNQYVLGQERNRNVFKFTTLFPAVIETIDLTTEAHGNRLFGASDNVGNMGLEGISYDPMTSTFLGVKEHTPIEIYRFTFDDLGAQAITTTLFNSSIIAALGVTDLADVQSLGAVPSLAGSGREDNFLVLSEESSKVLELDSDGTVLSTLDLSADTANWAHEGVTIDHAGYIYVVAEQTDNTTTGRMFVYAPVPEPSAALLLTGSLGFFAARRRRKS